MRKEVISAPCGHIIKAQPRHQRCALKEKADFINCSGPLCLSRYYPGASLVWSINSSLLHCPGAMANEVFNELGVRATEEHSAVVKDTAHGL